MPSSSSTWMTRVHLDRLNSQHDLMGFGLRSLEGKSPAFAWGSIQGVYLLEALDR